MRFTANSAIEYLPVGEARALLSDGIEDAFHDAMHWAWAKWKDGHPGLLTLPSRSLRAMGLHELALEKLNELLADHARVIIAPPRPGVRRAHFAIKDTQDVIRMIVQTKKLDPMHRTRNIMTTEARHFDAQRAIPGIPVGPRVTLGYRVVNGGTDIATDAVYRVHRKVEWNFELCTNRVVEQLRLPDNRTATAAKPRVTGKAGIVPKKRDGEGTSDGEA
jgi:hypothetical protein